MARIYLALAADLENLRLARSTLQTRQEAYQLIQKRYEAGITNELDLQQAQTQVDITRGNVAAYTQLTAQAQNALNLLAGSPVPAELYPRSMSSIRPFGQISIGLPSEVLLERPDILQAEHQLKAVYANIGAARAAFFPKISLTSSVGTASAELSGLFKSGSDTWNFAPQIQLPIFDMRIWSALRVSKADQAIALTRYEKAIQTAFREVADTLAVANTVDEQVAAQQAVVDASRKVLDLSDKRYTHGLDSYLTVLDAQRSLYGAQQGLISLRQAKLSNQVRLYAVLGGGGKTRSGTER